MRNTSTGYRGDGGNVAVAAARVLGPKEVALIGALGTDDIAGQQVGILEAEGILTTGIHQVAGVESGQAHILVDGLEKRLLPAIWGANARLGLRQLRKVKIKRQLRKCRGVVLTDPPLEVAGELVKQAKQFDIPLLWDPGILISPHQDTFLSLAEEATVLFLNETEASVL